MGVDAHFSVAVIGCGKAHSSWLPLYKDTVDLVILQALSGHLLLLVSSTLGVMPVFVLNVSLRLLELNLQSDVLKMP